MPKTIPAVAALIAGGLGLARVVLNDRVNEEADEIDLAVVASRRRYRVKARPFIGATIMVIAGDAELDLRRVLPSPTGIEVNVLVIGGRLVIVASPEWNIVSSLSGGSERQDGDAPTLWVKGRRTLGTVRITRRSVPTAVAS